MIQMAAEAFEGLDTPGGLQDALQKAIELEHATIPVYLYTVYSLDPAHNAFVRRLIRGVAKEEMGHFAIACNLLNAIGGTPAIATPTFVPDYPRPLPGSVNTGLTVSLRRFSLDHVKEVFMEIEEPENPLMFRAAESAIEFKTIGDFYRAIAKAMRDQGPGIFTGDPSRQVGADVAELPNVVKVSDVASAMAAIDQIVEQGEGTSESPKDDHDALAHYYKFAEIYHQKTLERDPTVPDDGPPEDKYKYSGAPLIVDPAHVFPLRDNPKAVDMPASVRDRVDDFNRAYTRMLGQLQLGFTGQPDQVGQAIDTMRSDLSSIARTLVTLDLGDGTHAGPTFEYLP